MRRRDFLTLMFGAMGGWSRAAYSQQNLLPAIGLLLPESPVVSADFVDVFREALGKRGFVEGKNVTIEYRSAEGQNARLPALAADLVQRHVAVIVALGSTPGSFAAKRATSTIPIVVVTGGDPVALGFAASLSRPGGNVTGVTNLGTDLAAKRVELLHELLPDAATFAVLVNPTNPGLADLTKEGVRTAGRVLGVKIQIVTAGTEEEIEKAFALIAAQHAQALVIQVDFFFSARRKKLAQLALRNGIPAIYQYRDFATEGGVMSFGGNLDAYRIAGDYAGRILKGEKPADLPFQQVTQTRLVINLKSAEALHLRVPAALVARADEVIE